MSLRQQIEDDVGTVFLNAEEFGEPVEVLPVGAAAFEATAAVSDERIDVDEGDRDKREVEFLELLFATSVYPRPRPGDRLRRLNEPQPRRDWSLKQTSSRDEAGTVVQYTRPLPTRSGGSAAGFR
jgi:hypothetical protein